MTLMGYWSFTSLQSGSEHDLNQRIEQLEQENKDLQKEMKVLEDELDILRPLAEVKEEIAPEETASTETKVYKYQSLINEIQKLIDGNVFLKLKSSGVKVGVLQEFLNIYNNTSNKVDNDYGLGTEKAIIAFQKEQGIGADGEAGPGTFLKMIDWLKKQN